MLFNCITVYRYESNKSMLICAIIIMKDHKMKQIINYLPKINPELYLNSSIIKKILFNVSPSDVTFCQMIPINDNSVLYNHDHKISLHRSNHHLKHHNIVIGQTSFVIHRMSNICSLSMENTQNNVEFGVLQKTSKQSLISFFF